MGKNEHVFGLEVIRKSKFSKNIFKKRKKREFLDMMVLNFLYSNRYYFFSIFIIVIIIVIIIIFLLPTYFSLGGKATELIIFQHFKAKFDQHNFS